MTRILAIETATSSCSVALRIDGEIIERAEVGNNVHSQVVLSMVASLLEQASIDARSLDAIAVGQGPGSFTGLRIGVGIGQGLAYGAGCPMIGVSSLDALAAQSKSDGVIIAGIDARMGEVYWCGYQKFGARISRSGDLKVSAPEDVSGSGSSTYVLVGNAWSEYQDKFTDDFKANAKQEEGVVYPGAAALLALAEDKYAQEDWVSAIDFEPIYVRNDVARKSSKK